MKDDAFEKNRAGRPMASAALFIVISRFLLRCFYVS